jgi:hypothetical protein
VISVTERQSYILARARSGESLRRGWLKTEAGGADMSETPESGGRKPLPINVEAERATGGAPAAAPRSSRSATARTRPRPFSPREFKPETTGEVWFCTCKRTTTPPLCDGSHKKLT